MSKDTENLNLEVGRLQEGSLRLNYLAMELRDKTILIIGGSAGIGLALAKQLCQKGNKVIITGRDEEKLKDAIKSLRSGHYEVADVTSGDAVRQLRESIAK